MTFLDEIIPEIRVAIGEPGYGSGIPEPPPRHRRSLRRALEQSRGSGGLIVEFKRVSPGQRDPVLPVRTVAEFVEVTRGAASAYSCLATTPRFRGSPSDVADLARATDLPVLFKDFVIDRRQLEVAARAGASAVLLIARLGHGNRQVSPLAWLADAAHRLGMEVVLEFHDKSELSSAAGVSADVYGVNARDLDTLAIDRSTALATLEEARDRGLRPLLGLSGVESARDARRFWEAGVDGILVGTAVARASNPQGFLSTLRREPLGGGR